MSIRHARQRYVVTGLSSEGITWQSEDGGGNEPLDEETHWSNTSLTTFTSSKQMRKPPNTIYERYWIVQGVKRAEK